MDVGDVVRGRLSAQWQRWDGTGKGWRVLRVEPGAVVTAGAGGGAAVDGLWVVTAMVRVELRPWVTRVVAVCEPWPEGGWVVSVPVDWLVPRLAPDEAIESFDDARRRS